MKVDKSNLTWRERIAIWLIGDQNFLHLGKRDQRGYDAAGMFGLGDDALGKITRRWFTVVDNAVWNRKTGEQVGLSEQTLMTQHAVLTLAKLMEDSGNEALTVIVSGTIDGYVTERSWGFQLVRCDNDADPDELEVNLIKAFDTGRHSMTIRAHYGETPSA